MPQVQDSERVAFEPGQIWRSKDHGLRWLIVRKHGQDWWTVQNVKSGYRPAPMPESDLRSLLEFDGYWAAS